MSPLGFSSDPRSCPSDHPSNRSQLSRCDLDDLWVVMQVRTTYGHQLERASHTMLEAASPRWKGASSSNPSRWWLRPPHEWTSTYECYPSPSLATRHRPSRRNRLQNCTEPFSSGSNFSFARASQKEVFFRIPRQTSSLPICASSKSQWPRTCVQLVASIFFSLIVAGYLQLGSFLARTRPNTRRRNDPKPHLLVSPRIPSNLAPRRNRASKKSGPLRASCVRFRARRRSSGGQEVTNDGWSLSLTHKQLAWLPRHWGSDGVWETEWVFAG